MSMKGSRRRSSVSFQDVKGQTAVGAALQASLLKDRLPHALLFLGPQNCGQRDMAEDRKSTRLNSSHSSISYAVFFLNKFNNIYAHSFKQKYYNLIMNYITYHTYH